MKRLIRASAGSGKTFQLSGHFLRQLFQGHRPETILATTFTRKAAGEILGRVLLRLAEAAEDPKAAKRLADFLAPADVTTATSLALLTDVTRNLHRLRVCTLDSFFQQVARSLTLELGLSPGWSIVDEHTDRELREQSIDAVLSQHVPQDAQNLMQMLAKGRSKRSVRDLIDDTVSDYHELFLLTDDEAWNKLPRYNRLTKEQREQALRDLYAAPLATDKRFIKARAEDMERFQAELWDEFIDKGLTKAVLSGGGKFYGKALNDEVIEIYERLISHAKAELLDRLALQMKAIRNLMTRFDREYSRLRAEHGWLRFNDVTRVLARSAGAASGQRMNFRLDSSIRNLLLDEFQDTSSDQWKILKRLTQSLENYGEESSFFVWVTESRRSTAGEAEWHRFWMRFRRLCRELTPRSSIPVADRRWP
jgi:ATP-dependent helicase/nuclease subunit A